MAVSSKTDSFGIHLPRFLSMLKGEPQVSTVPFDESESGVLLIQSSFCLFRTWTSEELLAKYPIPKEVYHTTRARDGWKQFETEIAQTRLYVTNMLSEDSSGSLVRKLVDSAGHCAWIQRKYLDVFGTDASLLSDFLFESIPYYGRKDVGQCPIRISRKAEYTSGYVMPFVNQAERIFK